MKRRKPMSERTTERAATYFLFIVLCLAVILLS